MEASRGKQATPPKGSWQVSQTLNSTIISEIQQHKLRDQLEQEVKNLRTNFANLEALQHNTKVLPVLNHFLLCYKVALIFLDMKSYRTTWWRLAPRLRNWGRSWTESKQRAQAIYLVRTSNFLEIMHSLVTLLLRRWSKRNARNDIEFEEVPRSRTAQIDDAGTGKTQFWR